MKRYAAIIVFFLSCLAHLPQAFAQYESEGDATIPLDHFYIKKQGINPFRRVLSKVTLGLSTGYGQTAFRHDLKGYGILQNPDMNPAIFPISEPATLYSNWFNEVEIFQNTAAPGAFTVTSEDRDIGFKNNAFNIPLKATLHVEFDRFRIGGGYSFEYTKMGDFQPLSDGQQIESFSPDVSSFFLKKYFGLLGVSAYRYYEYLLVVDAQIGGYGLGKQFDKSVIKKGVFINVGVTLEREMSEYFKIFIRPSYEIKGYQLNMPDGRQSIKHQFNAFYVNIGATYRLPELRRCFIKNCHAQLNHTHGNRSYRSRVHPIYKKQNPHYGENYPTLIKYKGKNKKKLNPY